MNQENLKEKLHNYIDNASEEELNELLCFFEDDIVYETSNKKREWWEDEEFVKELDRRTEEIESGKVKGIPAEEVHANAIERLKNRKKSND